MLTKDQVAARVNGLFGTDASAIEYTNPDYDITQCWAVKTRRITEASTPNNAMMMGHQLEHLIRTFYYPNKTGDKARASCLTIYHKTVPYLGAHIDGKIVGKRKGLEIKVCGFYYEKFWGEDGTDQIPSQYRSQIKHYALVTGLMDWDVACWFKTRNELNVYHVSFSKDELDALLAKEVKFWEHNVLGDVPPEVNGSISCGKAYKKMYPVSRVGSCKATTDEVITWIKGYSVSKNEISRLEEVANRERNRLVAWLKDYELARDSAGKIWLAATTDKNGRRSIRITKMKGDYNG